MYGLKQAAVLAYIHLSKNLKDEKYYHIISTLGLWKNHKRKTIFGLCVDDCGVKYYNLNDIKHLKTIIEQQYTCKIDYTGNHFLRFTLNWNYKKGFVDITMPDYVKHALQKLQHIPKVHPQYSPHNYVITKWTQKGD